MYQEGNRSKATNNQINHLILVEHRGHLNLTGMEALPYLAHPLSIVRKFSTCHLTSKIIARK